MAVRPRRGARVCTSEPCPRFLPISFGLRPSLKTVNHKRNSKGLDGVTLERSWSRKGLFVRCKFWWKCTITIPEETLNDVMDSSATRKLCVHLKHLAVYCNSSWSGTLPLSLAMEWCFYHTSPFFLLFW